MRKFSNHKIINFLNLVTKSCKRLKKIFFRLVTFPAYLCSRCWSALNKVENINTLSNIIQSSATVALVIWGIFFSPLSEFREVEREQLRTEVDHLTKTKADLELEVGSLETTRQNNEKYLNHLTEISCSDFIGKIEKNLQEYQSNYHLVSSFYSKRIGYREYLERDKKLDEKLESLKEEELKCWTQSCYTDIKGKINSEINNDIKNVPEVDFARDWLIFHNKKNIESVIGEEEEVAKSIVAKFDEYNLFHLIKVRLDAEDFSLVLPDKKELLRRKIAIFLSSNAQTLSKPLMIRTSFKNKPPESEIEKVDKNYSEAFSKLVELNNIMLSTTLE